MITANRHVDLLMVSHETAKAFNWEKWRAEIPYLNFPRKWEVKIIPPFTGAVIRFWVKTKSMTDEDAISIYLDCYDVLGFVGQPYWEVYPDKNGDTSRCLMNETEELLAIIKDALKKKKK